MRLIISEKSIAGQRIAEILADGKINAKREAGANYFQFSKGKEEVELIPLRGHITELDFPSKYKNWYGTDLKELANAEILYIPSEKEIANLLKAKAKQAESVVIATDADREGESIGLEAIRFLKEGNPSIKEERAYFSAITPKEITASFNNLQKVDYNLAHSADTRREIDLIWGAVLTRFISLMSGRTGKEFLSVGRVQTPSVDYSEEIFIKNPDGLVELQQIGKFVEENSLELERTIGNCDVFKSKTGFEALSFNPESLKLEFKPITQTVRHRHLGNLIEVKLETGRKVKITGTHSVFVLRDSKILVLVGEELKEGDVLLSPKKFKTPEINELSILEGIRKLPEAESKNFFVYNAFRKKRVILNENGIKFLKAKKTEKGIIIYKTRFKSSTISQWENGKKKKADYQLLSDYLQALDSSIDFFTANDFGKIEEPKRKVLRIKEIDDFTVITQNSHIGCYDKRWTLPVKVEMSNELARLLGYYLAEGCASQKNCSLDFGPKEHELANDARKCIEKVFGRQPAIITKKSALHINFGGSFFSKVLQSIFKVGKNARVKRIPRIIFNLTNEKKIEFLKGYFEGDGNYSESGQLMCATASEKLASDLLYLLSTIGILATVEKIKNNSLLPNQSFSKERTCYKVKVSGKESLKILKNSVPARHLERLEKYLACDKTRCGFDGIPIQETGISGIWTDLPRHYAQRISTQKLTSLVENTNKRLSTVAIQKLKAFADSDLLFLKIKKIEKCKPTTDFVFDISVKDNENFVGGSGGIILHNTLAIVVDREKERNAFKPVPYWELKAVLEKDKRQFEAMHKKARFLSENEAKTAFEKASKAEFGTVKEVIKSKRSLAKPIPFNTTEFLRAASSIDISPGEAMNLAESLYMQGFISYPRTDNTAYSESIDLKEILEGLKSTEFKALAEKILAKGKLDPSKGKETKDHPPIHPELPAVKGKLGDRQWKIYELVVRRFLATLSENCETENLNVEISLNEEPFVAKGQLVTKLGWKEFYPYSTVAEIRLPELKEGDKCKKIKLGNERKETQPPARYSQAALIKLMEQLGLGTKATRAEIIQKLYNRQYIFGSKAIEPNKIAFAVIDALQKYCDKVTKPEMTSELEKKMDEIAEGKKTKQEIVKESRNLLLEILTSLLERKNDVAEEIRKGQLMDSILGKCPNCEGNLRVLFGRTGKRFVGCTGYPNCRTSYPLPQKGKITWLGKNCPECNAPMISVQGNRGKWEMCLNMDCKTKDEWKKKSAEKKARIEAGKIAEKEKKKTEIKAVKARKEGKTKTTEHKKGKTGAKTKAKTARKKTVSKKN